MHRSGLVCSLTALFVCRAGLSAEAQALPAATLLDQGLALLEAGNCSAAVSALRQATQHCPTDPNAHLAFGLAACCLGDLATAKSAYQTAIGLRTSSAPAHNAMGLLLLRTGDQRLAYTHFQNAVRFDPGYGEARANLAYALCLQGIAGQAAKECQAAIAQAPDYPFLLEVAATANILQGDFGTATEQIRQLLTRTALGAGELVDLSPAEETPVAAVQEPQGTLGSRPSGTSVTSQSIELSLAQGRLLTSSPLPAPVVVSEETVVSASSALADCRYVAFLVDGVMRAVTNSTPYRWVWDTRQVENGPHVVAAQAYGPGGMILSQEFRHVVVRHTEQSVLSRPTAPGSTLAAAPADPAQVERRLRQLLHVRPDPLRARALLAATCEQRGLADAALAEYTRLFIEDPGRGDAHAAVLRLRQQLSYVPPVPVTEVWRVADAGHRLALTFDDGPRPFFTEKILDTLRKHGIKATFFVVGKMAAAYPNLMQAILAEGHEVANHTHSHPNLSTLSSLSAEQELLQAELAIQQACQVRTRLFRPPGGNYNGNVKSALRRLGYVSIFWGPNITSWKGRDPEEISSALARQAEDGCFVLLHNGRDETVYVLPKLIEYLERLEFRFLTVSELLRSGQPISTGQSKATNEY